VVGQYFGLFHGCSKQHFATIVESAPFDCCNLLILAFIGLRETGGDQWGVAFGNGRDNDFNGGKATSDDTDEDRLRLVVKTARQKNPGLKILLSMGYYNEVVKAARAPEWFAQSFADLVHSHRAAGVTIDGFDIDWEDNWPYIKDPFSASDFVTLMQWIGKKFVEVIGTSPILTLCPARLFKHHDPLDKSVLDCFTYVMPQSYKHGGDDTRVDDYAQMLGWKYDKILYGLSGEGYLEPKDYPPDDPQPFVTEARRTGAAGIFSWRLDTDTMPKQKPKDQDEGPDQLPIFAAARKMWQLMPGQ
jgi:hypothetical protein